MERRRRGWYERQEEKKINQDWVDLYCKNITSREIKLLEYIEYRKMASREHLQYLVEEYRDLASSTKIINNSLSKLYQKHCLDKCHEELPYGMGNAPAIYSLDRAGALLLNLPFRRRFKKVKKATTTLTLLPTNFKHIHKVNELEVQTLKKCFEYNCKLFRWDLEHLNKKVIPTNSGKVALISDVFVVINKQNLPIVYFLEYDTGNEDFRNSTSFPTLKEKLDKYYIYKTSGIWRTEWFNVQLKTGFPTIVFVTEDKKRIPYLNKYFKQLQLTAYVMEFEQYEKWLTHKLS